MYQRMDDSNPAQVANHTFVPSGADLERQQRQPRRRKTRHLIDSQTATYYFLHEKAWMSPWNGREV